MEYRNEMKYLVSSNDINILNHRIKNIMTIDPLAKKKIYNIRSIYFDTYDNRCYFENESGLDNRFKMRIRIYNHSSSDIKLELKYKYNGFTKKISCDINEQMCQKLIKGERINYTECKNKVLKKLYLEQRMHLLVPKIIVEYDRVAYVEKVGNVRVTFDMNIRASKYINRFFSNNIYARPILNNSFHILEIKYDELLPDYITKSLQVNNLSRTSFSKYYLSRLAFKEEIL